MQVLHIIRKQEEVSETVSRVLEAEPSGGESQVMSLAEAERDPEGAGPALLAAIQEADRVICW